jgi:hypothetical protein
MTPRSGLAASPVLLAIQVPHHRRSRCSYRLHQPIAAATHLPVIDPMVRRSTRHPDAAVRGFPRGHAVRRGRRGSNPSLQQRGRRRATTPGLGGVPRGTTAGGARALLPPASSAWGCRLAAASMSVGTTVTSGRRRTSRPPWPAWRGRATGDRFFCCEWCGEGMAPVLQTRAPALCCEQRGKVPALSL